MEEPTKDASQLELKMFFEWLKNQSNYSYDVHSLLYKKETIKCQVCGKPLLTTFIIRKNATSYQLERSPKFCSESCKKHYREAVPIMCKNCGKEVKEFVKVGNDVMPFCNQSCIAEYKKTMGFG